jgi:hypothetical protein
MIDRDPAYQSYLRARDAVIRMTRVSTADGVAAPSEYWTDELSNIDYMIEASPLIVRKLRHHAFNITGLRPYDYRIQDDSRRQGFEQRFRALIELGGRDLVVPENPALGGFGYRLDEGLFNLDTLKFFEVLVGMKRAGVLAALQAPGSVVVEIGAGWGGFAYQLKTLLPHLTYVIVDLPELFLFSATYLQTVFPDARVVFADDTPDAGAWQGADFVFVPNTQADAIRGVTPSVTVNMASFQEMTAAQVETYARLASEAGSRWLYSLNRERSHYNSQLTSVSECLGRYYTLTDVTLFDIDYTKAMKKISRKANEGSPKKGSTEVDLAYRHLVGERRGVAAGVPTRQRSDAPAVGIGVTLFNRAPYLREALDSLLAQTYRDFRLVLVDDGSSDDTETIAREYAAGDSRITYVRHAERQGMTATWREAFEQATAADGVRYFAWASDHDRWDAGWLERLVAELDADADVVLAWPYTRRIDDRGRLLDKPPRLFETRGLRTADERWSHMCEEHVASGDMVYGLMRAGAVRQAGVFRDVMCPDRLLMAELSLQGEFRQVPEELWVRRQFAEASVARQRTSLFADRGPRGRWLPPWLQHGRSLWATYVTAAADDEARGVARRRVIQYSSLYLLKHQQKTTTYRQLGSVLRGITWTRKKAKHYVLLGLFHTLVGTRRAYHRTVYEVAIFTRRIGLR